MKKPNYKSFVMMLILMLGLAPALVFGQEDGKAEKKDRSSFDNHLYLQASGGVSQFYGDLNPDLLFNKKVNFYYGFGLGFQFTPVIGARGVFQNGWLNSEHKDIDRRFSSSLWDAQLHLTVSLTDLIFGYKPDRFLGFYGFTGGGFATYSSMLYKASDKAVIDRFGPEAEAPYSTEAKQEFVIPMGLGLNFRLAEKWDMNLEYNFRYTMVDDIDVIESEKKDHYATAMLGVTYKFKPSAGLKSMEKNYGLVKYETTPDPLERIGDTVCVNIKVKFPEKYFGKKAAMNFQPELKYAGTTRKLKPVNFQGEDVKGDGIVINYKNGGTYTYVDCIPYEPGMNVSELVVSPTLYEPKEPVALNATPEEVIAKYKVINLPERKLADGVINTGVRITHDENLIIAEHGYGKENIISQDATIYFAVNKHDLNWNLPLNRNNESQRKLNELATFIKMGYSIRDIDINAWASPEGEESFNQGLSERRAQTGKKQILDLFNKMSKDKKEPFVINESDVKFNTYANGEDWDGFMQAVEASNIGDKRLIMNVVNSQPNVTKREQEIRNMSVVYREIEEDILPPLRRAVISVNCFEPKKTDEQIAAFATSDPSKLNEKELLYAATLTEDNDTKLRIYKSATTQFANDWKGFNNAAVIELENNQLGEAVSHLNKADQLEPNNMAVINNLGALSSKKNDYKAAAVHYNKAKSLGADVNYNLGITQMAAGHYDQAISLMGNKKCNTNVGLAQIMAGKYNDAANTLKCAPESGQNYYLMAVAGARANNIPAMVENLAKAIEKDPSLKAQAAEDREFIKFFNTPEFIVVIK